MVNVTASYITKAKVWRYQELDKISEKDDGDTTCIWI